MVLAAAVCVAALSACGTNKTGDVFPTVAGTQASVTLAQTTAEETQTTQSQTTAQEPVTLATEAETEKETESQKETEKSSEIPLLTFATPSEPTYINGILIVNKTYGLPSDYNPGEVPEARAAFDRMSAAAAAEGLRIYASSSFRSYDHQVRTYSRYVYYDGQELADTYSARPGFSEHQTGLTFDMNTVDDAFGNTAEAAWVAEHCHEYGFIVRYPLGKEDITGYQYEPWHVRYLGVDVATDVYNSGLSLEEYLGVDSKYQE